MGKGRRFQRDHWYIIVSIRQSKPTDDDCRCFSAQAAGVISAIR